MRTEQARGLIDSQLEELGEALAAGRSDRLQAFLATMARFHRYSLGNTLLIMVQRPEATHVAGFGTWLKLGRAVKKGEKGIAILAPIKGQIKEEPQNESEKIRGPWNRSEYDLSTTEWPRTATFSRWKTNLFPTERDSRASRTGTFPISKSGSRSGVRESFGGANTFDRRIHR